MTSTRLDHQSFLEFIGHPDWHLTIEDGVWTIRRPDGQKAVLTAVAPPPWAELGGAWIQAHQEGP